MMPRNSEDPQIFQIILEYEASVKNFLTWLSKASKLEIEEKANVVLETSDPLFTGWLLARLGSDLVKIHVIGFLNRTSTI